MLNVVPSSFWLKSSRAEEHPLPMATETKLRRILISRQTTSNAVWTTILQSRQGKFSHFPAHSWLLCYDIIPHIIRETSWPRPFCVILQPANNYLHKISSAEKSAVGHINPIFAQETQSPGSHVCCCCLLYFVFVAQALNLNLRFPPLLGNAHAYLFLIRQITICMTQGHGNNTD